MSQRTRVLLEESPRTAHRMPLLYAVLALNDLDSSVYACVPWLPNAKPRGWSWPLRSEPYPPLHEGAFRGSRLIAGEIRVP